jgi:hypothetical protein
MKTMLTIMAIILSIQLMAQTTSSTPFKPWYVSREMMKVLPGKNAEYLKTEALWKKVHQKRVAEGKIIGWALFRCIVPRGTNTEYDYMTVTTFKSGKELEDSTMNWAYITKDMTKEDLEIMNNTESTRNLTTSVLSKTIEKVGSVGKYLELTQLKVIPGKGSELEKMEKEMNPVFVEIAKTGKIWAWRFNDIIYPVNANTGDYTRVISCNTMHDMLTWSDNDLLKNTYKQVYPSKDPDTNWQAFRSIMTINQVELWEKIDETK